MYNMLYITTVRRYRRSSKPADLGHSSTAVFKNLCRLVCFNAAIEHVAWLQAKRKYHEVLAVKQQLDGDNQELQQKYSQKAM